MSGNARRRQAETDNGALNGVDPEPPDQGLCATGNTVVETVNLVVSVYTESGVTVAPPV